MRNAYLVASSGSVQEGRDINVIVLCIKYSDKIIFAMFSKLQTFKHCLIIKIFLIPLHAFIPIYYEMAIISIKRIFISSSIVAKRFLICYTVLFRL